MSHEEFIARVPIFASCTPDEIAVIASVAQDGFFQPSQIIVTQGTPGQAFYLILSGRVEILRDGVSLGGFGPGDFFGEMSLLDQAPRSATIRAIDQVSCVMLSSWDFKARPRAASVDRHQALGSAESQTPGGGRTHRRLGKGPGGTHGVEGNSAAPRRGRPHRRPLPVGSARHAGRAVRGRLGGRSGGRSGYVSNGVRRVVKVKPDAYFGTDPAKIADRSLSFYRQDAGLIALQAVADSSTRDPGWIYTSEADEVFYYYLAISQSEDEVRALFAEPDESFFAGLKVDRDDLLVLPLAPARAWFAERAERYPSRPVAFEGYSAWYRLVPRAEIQNALSGVTDRGPIFGGLGG